MPAQISPQRTATGLLLLLTAIATGCTVSYRPDSPEVRYSSESSERRALQVPPDLTGAGDGEQFVVPGNTGAAVTRNTVLPEFDAVKLVRQGDLSWLAIGATPESLWPGLLSFLEKEKWPIAMTRPVNGLISTDWKRVGAGWQRAAFRMERDGDTSRLFTRTETVSDRDSATPGKASWPESASNTEQTAALLQRLLVFYGIAEQRAKGLLNAGASASILDHGTIESGSEGARLVVHSGYNVAVAALQRSARESGYRLNTTVSPGGVYKLEDPQGRLAADGESSLFRLQLNSLHVSAVVVRVSDNDGRALAPELERTLLNQLKSGLITA